MVTTVGSMAVTGKFAAGAILSGINSIIAKIKQTGFESKNLKTEMVLMTGSMKAMAMAAGLTGVALLSMLVNASHLDISDHSVFAENNLIVCRGLPIVRLRSPDRGAEGSVGRPSPVVVYQVNGGRKCLKPISKKN